MYLRVLITYIEEEFDLKLTSEAEEYINAGFYVLARKFFYSYQKYSATFGQKVNEKYPPHHYKDVLGSFVGKRERDAILQEYDEDLDVPWEYLRGISTIDFTTETWKQIAYFFYTYMTQILLGADKNRQFREGVKITSYDIWMSVSTNPRFNRLMDKYLVEFPRVNEDYVDRDEVEELQYRIRNEFLLDFNPLVDHVLDYYDATMTGDARVYITLKLHEILTAFVTMAKQTGKKMIRALKKLNVEIFGDKTGNLLNKKSSKIDEEVPSYYLNSVLDGKEKRFVSMMLYWILRTLLKPVVTYAGKETIDVGDFEEVFLNRQSSFIKKLFDSELGIEPGPFIIKNESLRSYSSDSRSWEEQIEPEMESVEFEFTQNIQKVLEVLGTTYNFWDDSWIYINNAALKFGQNLLARALSLSDDNLRRVYQELVIIVREKLSQEVNREGQKYVSYAVTRRFRDIIIDVEEFNSAFNPDKIFQMNAIIYLGTVVFFFLRDLIDESQKIADRNLHNRIKKLDVIEAVRENENLRYVFREFDVDDIEISPVMSGNSEPSEENGSPMLPLVIGSSSPVPLPPTPVGMRSPSRRSPSRRSTRSSRSSGTPTSRSSYSPSPSASYSGSPTPSLPPSSRSSRSSYSGSSTSSLPPSSRSSETQVNLEEEFTRLVFTPDDFEENLKIKERMFEIRAKYMDNNVKVSKKVEKGFRELPKWVRKYIGTDERLKFDLVYGLTSQFGGPYFDVTVTDFRDDEIRDFKINIPGYTPYDALVAYWVMVYRYPTMMDEIDEVYWRFTRQFFSVSDPKNFSGYSLPEGVYFTSNTYYQNPGEYEDLATYYEGYGVKVFGEAYDDFVEYFENTLSDERASKWFSRAKDGFEDLIKSKKFTRGDYKKQIRKYYKDRTLPRWIVDYARSDKIQDILLMNGQEIEAYFVYYFTSEFDANKFWIKVGPRVSIPMKFGKVSEVNIFEVVARPISDRQYQYVVDKFRQDNPGLSRNLIDEMAKFHERRLLFPSSYTDVGETGRLQRNEDILKLNSLEEYEK